MGQKQLKMTSPGFRNHFSTFIFWYKTKKSFSKLITKHGLCKNSKKDLKTPLFSSLLPLPFLFFFFLSSQSLSKLLDEELDRPLVSEERDHEQDDRISTDAFDQQDAEFQWTRNTRDQPGGTSTGDGAVQRFLGELLGLPQPYQDRSKKGLSRSCFGVKLDRIGSLSGLGC